MHEVFGSSAYSEKNRRIAYIGETTGEINLMQTEIIKCQKNTSANDNSICGGCFFVIYFVGAHDSVAGGFILP